MLRKFRENHPKITKAARWSGYALLAAVALAGTMVGAPVVLAASEMVLGLFVGTTIFVLIFLAALQAVRLISNAAVHAVQRAGAAVKAFFGMNASSDCSPQGTQKRQKSEASEVVVHVCNATEQRFESSEAERVAAAPEVLSEGITFVIDKKVIDTEVERQLREALADVVQRVLRIRQENTTGTAEAEAVRPMQGPL